MGLYDEVGVPAAGDARARRGRWADDGRGDRPLERGRAALRPRGRGPAASRLAGARRVATQVTLSAEESTNVRQRGPGPAPAPAPADPVRAASVRAIAEQLSSLRGPLLPVLHEVVATHGYVTDDDVDGRRRGAQPLARRRARRRHLLPRPAPHSPGRAPGRPVPRRGLPGASAPRRCTPRPPTAGPARPTSRWARCSASALCAVGPSGTVDGRSTPAVARTARRAHAGVARMTTGLGARATPPPSRSVRTTWPTPSRPPGSRCVRNGSRGMLWLEPLVEVETDARPGRLRQRHRGRASAPLLDGALDDTDRCIGVVDEHRLAGPPAPGDVRPGRGHRPDSTSPTTATHGGLGRAPARAVARPRTRSSHEVTDVRPARPRRRRLPGRHQVEDRAARPPPT